MTGSTAHSRNWQDKREGLGARNFEASRPKLPAFDEQKRQHGFLERYERFATSQESDGNDWTISLSSLLTGNDLQVYSSMPPQNEMERTMNS